MTRILVIRTGRIGDCVFAASILNALPAAFGDNLQIDWLTSPVVASLFAHDPRVQRVFTIKSRNAPLLINGGKLRLIKQSWQTPYDVIINLETATFFNSMIKLMRKSLVIGQPADQPEKLAHNIHAVDCNFSIARHLPNINTVTQRAPRLYGAPWKAVKAKFTLPARYIILSPANSNNEDKTKRNFRAWPEQHWVKLLSLLTDLPVYVVGIPSLAPWLKQLIRQSGSQATYLANTSLPELISIIGHATTTVTADTGTVHIAAATGCHVIGLYGPSPVDQTGPYVDDPSKVHILTADLPCRPCKFTPLEKTCQLNQCMIDISPEQVKNSVLTVFS